MTPKLPVKPVLEAEVRSKVAPKAPPHHDEPESKYGMGVEVVATCRYCGKRRLCVLVTWLDQDPAGDQRWRGAPTCRGCRQRSLAF